MTTSQAVELEAIRALVRKWRDIANNKHNDAFVCGAHRNCADQLEAALGSGPDGKMGEADFQAAWYEIAYLLGIGAQSMSPKDVHEKQVMPRLRKLRELESIQPSDPDIRQGRYAKYDHRGNLCD